VKACFLGVSRSGQPDLVSVMAAFIWISPKLSTALIPIFLTPQKTQKNHPEQHFWPNLFLGRWLNGLSWCLRMNSADYEVVGWECPWGQGDRFAWGEKVGRFDIRGGRTHPIVIVSAADA